MLALSALVERMIAVMPAPAPKRRWYHFSPGRLIVGLLAVEGFLFLSEQFQWFAFNEKKGWTVLIAVAAVCLVVVVMLLWFTVSLLLQLRFQFSVRSLMVTVVAAAIPCCWLAVKMRQAEKQRKAVEAIRQAGGSVCYHYQYTEDGSMSAGAEPPAPVWLRDLAGDDFSSDVRGVAPHAADDESLEHLKGLVQLDWLDLTDTQATDEDLQHLKGMTKLTYLDLSGTQVTDDGLAHLRGLPNLRWNCSDRNRKPSTASSPRINRSGVR